MAIVKWRLSIPEKIDISFEEAEYKDDVLRIVPPEKRRSAGEEENRSEGQEIGLYSASYPL